MTVKIPAKINLHLQVLGSRPDGFHELRTLMQAIDLYDTLDVAPAPEGDLELRVSPVGSAPSDDRNLVLRAARLLWHESGAKPGARMKLLKGIPTGSGLGGGSADAAATLVALCSLWSLSFDDDTLYRLAGELGSDVPFFLHGGLGFGVGRGEEIYPLDDLCRHAVVVARLQENVSTAEVYSRVPRQLTWARLEDSVYAFVTGAAALRWDRMVNDLQPIVCEGWPEVADLLDRMRGHEPVRAAVTGSGSAVFGIFDDDAAADRAAGNLAEIAWVHRGATLSRERSRLR